MNLTDCIPKPTRRQARSTGLAGVPLASLVRIAATVLPLATAAPAAPDEADDPAPPPPEIAVGPTSTRPKIDGRIEEGEWRSATRVTGFVTLGTPNPAGRDTAVSLTYDDENLYLAWQNEIPGNRPNAIEISRDGGVWGGDSIELSLAPPGSEPGRYYHFIGNHQGSIYDARVTPSDTAKKRKSDKQWNGDWRFANYVWEGVWAAEMAIPLADLGVDDPTGTWRMNFGRTQSNAHSGWSFTGKNFHQPDAFGIARLGEGEPVPRLESVQGLARGELDVKGSLYNGGEGPRAVTVEAKLRPVELLLGSDTSSLLRSVQVAQSDVAVPPGATESFRLEHDFADRKLDLLSLTIREGEEGNEGKVLSQSQIPFQLEERRLVVPIPTPEEKRLTLRLDLREIGGGRALSGEGRVLDQSGAEALNFALPNLTGGESALESIDIRPLDPGDYTLSLELTDSESGETVREESAPFTRRPVPEWYREGRKIGTDERVLAPWTDMERDDDAVSVWGRRYELGDSALCRQIISRGEPLLRAPIALEAEVGGKMRQFQFGKRRFTEVKPHRVEWTTRGRLGPVEVAVFCRAEYDGLIRATLSLRTEKPVEIEDLSLRVPLHEETSRYCHYSSSYYDSAEAGLVPEEGLQLPFLPELWLGSLERGLMWVAEAPRGWRVREEPLRVSPGPERNLRVRFVDHPSRLEGERSLEFGLLPTPVKPMPEGWRGQLLAGRYDEMEGWDLTSSYFAHRHMGQHPVGGVDRDRYWTDEEGRRIRVGHTTPLKLNTPYLRSRIAGEDERGVHSVVYQYLSAATVGRTTDFDRYVASWERLPPKVMDYGPIGHMRGACLGSSFQDFLLHGARHLVETTGTDGFYFDGGGGPSLCRNPLHGHGWTDPDSGRLRREYPVFEARRFNRRLATLLEEEKGPGNYVIWNHNSQTMPLAMLSFSTHYLDGEAPFQSVRDGGPTLPELVSLDYLRVMATGEHWGLVPTWLVYARRGDPSVFRATLAALLPHGAPLHPIGGVIGSDPDRRIMERVWMVQHDFDIGGAEFRGYWEDDSGLATGPADARVVASVYTHGDRHHLFVVSNLTKEKETVTLRLSQKEFPDLAQRSVRDALGGGAPKREGNVLRVPVEPLDFRLIAVE